MSSVSCAFGQTLGEKKERGRPSWREQELAYVTSACATDQNQLQYTCLEGETVIWLGGESGSKHVNTGE